MNKNILKSLSFLLIVVSVLFIGCEDNNGSSQTVITENNLFDNPFLSADPEIHTVIKFLEHPDSTGEQSDTGETGNDLIPLNYKRTINHTYCWNDDDDDSEHFMTILDSEGMEILRLGANEECVTELIEAGSYEMIIHHDGRIEETLPIFLVPEENLTARNQHETSEGIRKSTPGFLSKVLSIFDLGFTKTTMAQPDTQITTTLNTLMCVGCDLSGTDLSNLNFSSVNFFTANMTDALLVNTNLEGANLQNVTFTGVDLTVANLFQANLSNAIWTDGTCRCALNSLNSCVGCPPCPCNFNSVPMTSTCWGGEGLTAFTPLSTGGCGLNSSSGPLSQTMVVMTSAAGDTCQIIVRDQTCAQGVSNIPFISSEEVNSCVLDIENYVTQLNSLGITILDLQSFSCVP